MPNEKVPDFSSKATRKAVLRETLQHPVTLAGSAVGILGGMAGLMFNGGALIGTVAITGLSLGIVSWLINYFIRDKSFANRHLDALHAELQKQRNDTLNKIQADLTELSDLGGAEHLSEQGVDQFTLVQEKLKNFEVLLASKFDRNEITFGRYLGTAEQVYLSVLDNLLDIVHTLRSVATIESDYIDDRLSAIAKLPKITPADEAEIATLQKRKLLKEEQLEKVNILLTKNEEAFTALDTATIAISSLKTVKGRATADLDAAMSELQDLVARTGQYAKK
jgi:hypothetical protein